MTGMGEWETAYRETEPMPGAAMSVQKNTVMFIGAGLTANGTANGLESGSAAAGADDKSYQSVI